MSWLDIFLLAVVILLIGGCFALRAFLRNVVQRVKNDPEYQAQMALLRASYAAEETVQEEAPWFGTTGLPDDIERELPKYLRREFGELLLDEDSLKARDLTYVGSFSEDGGSVHYWRISPRSGDACFAYVEIDADGNSCTAWGDREPPVLGAAG